MNRMRPLGRVSAGLLGCAATVCAFGARSLEPPLEPRLELRDGVHTASGTPIREGTFRVYEDRAAQTGRVLALEVIVLPALEQPAEPDAVFLFAGGPGADATSHVDGWVEHWMRRTRDIVLVSQRGTGGDNRLTCDLPGSDDDLQGYLKPIFDVPRFRACLEELRQRADLRHYSTPEAMDDIDELRAALGYQKINLYGGSYGSRAELVYLRRHPQTVRCAILNSVAPLAFRNPLFHAGAAQEALDHIFELCAADEKYRAAFGDLRRKFRTVLARLEKEPASATVRKAGTGEEVTLRVSRDAFAEALRVIMYTDYRDVPRLIQAAYEGDFDTFAARGIQRNRGLRQMLAFGMLLCVTCAEDVARIDPDEIEHETRDTFLGDGRVRRQMAVCRFWPKSALPDGYGEPVRAKVPVLLLSGSLDPVTPPHWGIEAARHLPRSTHVVAPGSHGVGGACVAQIMRDFLQHPDQPIDTDCADELDFAPFRLP